MEKELINYLLKDNLYLTERVNNQYNLILLTNTALIMLAISHIIHLFK